MGNEHFMRLAIGKAREGVAKGNTPFGACLVMEGRVISCAHNRVWEDTDITAHAEIVAIREGCGKLGTINLGGCVLYSTCEPCPMCFTAIHWANISEIIYGVRIEDAKGMGFRELSISNLQMKHLGRSEIKIKGPFLLEETLDLFLGWASSPGKGPY